MVYTWHGTYMAKSNFELCSKMKCVRFVTLKRTINKEYYYKLRQGGAGEPEITKIRILIKGKLNTNPVKIIDSNIC